MGRSSDFGPKTQIMQFWSAHIACSTLVETGYNTYHTSFLRIFRQDVGAHHIHLCMYWKAIIAFLGDIWRARVLINFSKGEYKYDPTEQVRTRS